MLKHYLYKKNIREQQKEAPVTSFKKGINCESITIFQRMSVLSTPGSETSFHNSLRKQIYSTGLAKKFLKF